MPADFNWAIGGEAGDGIDSTGKIFAQALSRAGRHVFTSKDFASRIRGGYTAYKVRTSVDQVQSVVDRLDVLIALTQRTIDENLDELHEGSVIIYDGDRTTMEDVEIPEGMIGLDVPLQALAEEAGGAIMRNVVALGAACAVGEFPIEKDPQSDTIAIDSTVPEAVDAIVPTPETRYQVEQTPAFMESDDSGRTTRAFVSYAYNPDGGSLTVTDVATYSVDDRTVVFT